MTSSVKKKRFCIRVSGYHHEIKNYHDFSPLTELCAAEISAREKWMKFFKPYKQGKGVLDLASYGQNFEVNFWILIENIDIYL